MWPGAAGPRQTRNFPNFSRPPEVADLSTAAKVQGNSGDDMTELATEIIETPVGEIQICCSEAGVKELKIRWNRESGSVGFSRKDRENRGPRKGEQLSNSEGRAAAHIAARAKRELAEYFVGRRRDFSVPLDVEGTAFQKKVWKALSEIPYGEVRSYGQIAKRVGNPKASRAVGSANGANPVAIIVPCHRVIAGDGSLGGFGGGLTNKTYLLSLERSVSDK